MRKWFFLSLLFFTIPAFALQIKSVMSNDTVTANVSQNNKTRIFVSNDRISAIRGTPSAYTYINDDINGQVFITPTPDFKNKPFSLFITTEKGKTYGLNLTPVSSLSNSIMLKPQESISKKVAHRKNINHHENPVLELLHFMMNSMTPDSYTVTVISNRKPQTFNTIGTLQLITVYQGKILRGEIYRLSNTSNTPITVTDTQLSIANTRAIAIQAHTIAPHASTLVYEVINHG